MSSFKALTALAFLSLATTAYAAPCNGVWVPNTAGDWSTGFTPCIPGAAGDTATLGTPPSGPVAVNLDVNPTVTALNFQNVNTYTISGPAMSSITMDGGGALLPSSINVVTGNHVMNSIFTINNSALTVNLGTGASLDFFGSLDDTHMVQLTSTLVVNGPGQMNFHGTNPAAPSNMVVHGDTTFQNGANVTFENSVPLIATTSAINSSFLVFGQTTMNSDTLTFQNSAEMQNLGGGASQVAGVICNDFGPVLINGGTVNFINSGDISNGPTSGQAFGVLGVLNDNMAANGILTMNGGSLNVINSGAIRTSAGTTTCIGSGLVIFEQFNMNGGTCFINNTGTTNSNTLVGAGIIVLSASMTLPIPININGGTLINNGVVAIGAPFPAPGVVVGPQGTVAGNGVFSGINAMTFSLASTSLTNNGTVIPGIPDPIPGMMTIMGNYQQGSSGTLLSNMLNINSYGQVSVVDLAGAGGTATIAGNLNLYGVSGIKVKPGDAFKVVTTTKGVTGTFSSVKMLNTPYIPMVFYFPNFVEVILNAGTYPALYQSVFASVNHKNIRLEREMQNLHKRFAQEQVAPKEVAKNRMFSSRPGPTLATIDLASQSLSQAAPMHEERQQQRLHREMEYCNNTPWNVYFGPIGSVGEVHRKGFNAGFSEWSAGALAGFDYAFEEVGVGLLAEYERLHGDVHRNWGKFNIDQVEVSFYTTYVPQSVPELAVNGIIGGGYEGSHIRRNTGMTGNSVAQGNPNGWEVDALFGLEYSVSSKQVQEFSDNFTFTPMVNLQYVYVHFPKYKEHGAGIFDLSVSSLHAQSLRSTLGAWFNYLWQWTDLSINLEADVGWQREYFDRGSSINFGGVTSSTLKTRGAGRNTCLAGLDLFFTLFKTYGIEASYDFEWNKMFHDHSFYLGFNIEF